MENLTKQFYCVESQTLDNDVNVRMIMNTLVFQLTDVYNGVGYAFSDLSENKITLMQHCTVISSHKNELNTALQTWINESHPLKTGNLCFIDGILHSVRIDGDYSDAGELIPVSEKHTFKAYQKFFMEITGCNKLVDKTNIWLMYGPILDKGLFDISLEAFAKSI